MKRRGCSPPFSVALVAMALGCGDPDAPDAPSKPRELVWTNQEYDGDVIVDVDRLVVRAGASVRVIGGYLQVRTDVLVIEGPSFVDARGRPGASPDPPAWMSSGGTANLCLVAHRDWSLACTDRLVEQGSAGERGSTVVLRARRVTGDLVDLTVAVSGGPGGQATELRCGCRDHTRESCRGLDGPQGPDGTWTFVQE